MRIKRGYILKSKKWDEPILVEFVEDLGGFIRIIGKKVKSGSNFEDLLAEDEIKNIEVIKQQLDFSGDSKELNEEVFEFLINKQEIFKKYCSVSY